MSSAFLLYPFLTAEQVTWLAWIHCLRCGAVSASFIGQSSWSGLDVWIVYTRILGLFIHTSGRDGDTNGEVLERRGGKLGMMVLDAVAALWRKRLFQDACCLQESVVKMNQRSSSSLTEKNSDVHELSWRTRSLQRYFPVCICSCWSVGRRFRGWLYCAVGRCAPAPPGD
ncbi:hypothetical protein IWX46DRAFT_290764 [Phyllosticta citricarpa]|uniref:Secreted protein n=1 Tax=Phyllosticta citricarpa TaxID=55181 RepID=A0ABR1MNX0_9PEZI